MWEPLQAPGIPDPTAPCKIVGGSFPFFVLSSSGGPCEPLAAVAAGCTPRSALFQPLARLPLPSLLEHVALVPLTLGLLQKGLWKWW